MSRRLIPALVFLLSGCALSHAVRQDGGGADRGRTDADAIRVAAAQCASHDEGLLAATR